MALDMWFRDDVTRILTALASAGDQHGPEYQKALSDVALAFGVTLCHPGVRFPVQDVRLLSDSCDVPGTQWTRR